MRKFDDQDAQGANSPAANSKPGGHPAGSEPVLRLVVPRLPAGGRSASAEGLKALVDFAVGRGYYEHWNNAARPGVTPCKSKVFPTDRD